MRTRIPLLPLLLLPVGCGGGGDPRSIDLVRVEKARPSDFGPEADSFARFGFRRPRATSPEGGREGLEWETPEGWEELPATSLRKANFRVAGRPEAECYLTVLSGRGGGIEANVNRWRGQMGLPPLPGAEVAKLPRRAWMGQKASYLELRGTFMGRSGDRPREGWMLVGLILPLPKAIWTLKMTGPSGLLEKELANFQRLLSSLKLRAHEGPALSPPGSGGAGGLGWKAPPGWVVEPPRRMRIVTFKVGKEGRTVCYVSSLSRMGGGLLANLNRWRREVGMPPLKQEEAAALPKLRVLGREATLIQGEGDFRGTGADPLPGAGLLGLVVPQEGRTVFVKMVGPAAVVREQRVNFEAFCRSLEWK